VRAAAAAVAQRERDEARARVDQLEAVGAFMPSAETRERLAALVGWSSVRCNGRR
jgi:hypothetical protein